MKIIDMHCDTISRIYKARNTSPQTKNVSSQAKNASLRKNSFQLDLEKMKSSGYFLQNFAMFIDLDETENPYKTCQEQISLFREEMEKNKDLIRPVTTYKEMIENEKKGLMSALITIEEGQVCNGDVSTLKEFYALGARMMTFTWNHKNTLGSPAEPAHGSAKGGLTHLGIGFLDAMEQLGMIADVSHLSDQGILDVCRLAKKPFVASHSNARALCPRGRNLPDELIRAIAEKRGVIGVNFYGPFLTSVSDDNGCFYSYVTDIAKHIRHMVNIGGIASIGLGSDFDGIDDNLELKDCSHMELLESELRKVGFHESEIERIFYQNVLELYEELLG